jgi:hypothetical protein
MRDCQNKDLITNQWQNEVEATTKGDGDTSSWKRIEEYRINKPRQ